jgi:hypothetical protein
MTLLCEKIIVVKSKEVKSGWHLAESFKEGCGPKRTILRMTITSKAGSVFIPVRVIILSTKLIAVTQFNFLCQCRNTQYGPESG